MSSIGPVLLLTICVLPAGILTVLVTPVLVPLVLLIGLVVLTVGAGTVLLAELGRCLVPAPPSVLIGAALVVHVVVAGPELPTAGFGSVRVVADLLVAGLVVMAAGSVGASVQRLGVAAGVGSVALCVVAGALVTATRSAIPADGGSVSLLVAVAAVMSGLTVIAAGAARRDRPAVNAGIGFVLLAGADTVTELPAALGFVVRVAGVVLVLSALAQWHLRAVRLVSARMLRYKNDLLVTAAELYQTLARQSERDHEVRNGLAGLAGITGLLRPASAEEDRILRSAVATELARLDGILRHRPEEPTDQGTTTTDTTYAVEPVLRAQVVLRRAAGMNIRLHVAAGLRVTGESTVLSQVVANLLENCARYAPGAPVRMTAARHGERVRIRVTDLGPSPVSGSGVADAGTGGAGLGLDISRSLLAAEGGRLSLRHRLGPPPTRAPSFTVMVDLPGAGAMSSRE